MKTEKAKTQLTELLKADMRLPGTRADQINTVLCENIPAEELYVTLRHLVTVFPDFILPLSIAANQEGADWTDILYTATPIPEGWEELKGFANVAQDACIDQLESLGGREEEFRYTLRFAVLANHAGEAKGQISIDFQEISRPISSASHDAMTFKTDAFPDMLLRTLCDLGIDRVAYERDTRPVMQIGPMFKYHPERMRASRRYLKGKQVDGVQKGYPALTQDQYQHIVGGIVQEVQSRHMDFTIVQRDKVGTKGTAAMFAEVDLAIAYLAYTACGREIFDIPPRLADMLALSDSDDLQLSQIRTPYEALYLHFGARPELQFAPDWYCDGAYVLASHDAMTVWVTACNESAPSSITEWPIRAEPLFTFKFTPEDRTLDLGTAIDTAVARDLAELQEQASKTNKRQADADAAAAQLGMDTGAITVITNERVENQRQTILSRKDVAHKSLSLVVNALCYLTAYPDDISHEWPNGAPPALLEQAQTGAPNKRKRATQQLHSEGFTKIRLCGVQFREDNPLGGMAQDMNTVRAHWRRGHFRNQQHGPGRQLRKLVWIMPVLVNAAILAEGSELPGHIYKPSLPSE